MLGNHERYGTEIEETRTTLARECVEAGVHLLDPGTVRIGGVRFIGATLWTDLELEGKARAVGAHPRVGDELMDFQGGIEYEGKDFTTDQSVRRHREERRFIEHELAKAERAGDRAVVVTHHAPSPRSIHLSFEADPLNPAFASDLERVIEQYQPALWIHGHMHDRGDEWLGDTRPVANPAGFKHEGERGFDPALVIDLEEVTAKRVEGSALE